MPAMMPAIMSAIMFGMVLVFLWSVGSKGSLNPCTLVFTCVVLVLSDAEYCSEDAALRTRGPHQVAQETSYLCHT